MLHYNYLLLDAAKAEMNLYTAMELNPNYQSLYKGTTEEDLAGVAPYLFSIRQDTPFADWYFKEGKGQSWGILLFANAAFEDVYKHFRKFLMTKTEDGEQLYFRFYDPRVLRIFLPTCEPPQLKELFGSVRHFLTESENPEEVLQFWFENGQLKTKILALSEADQVEKNIPEIKPIGPEVKEKAISDEPRIDKPKKKWDLYLE